MMTLKFNGDFFDLPWTDLREAMEQEETYRSQLLADKTNANELRRELPAELVGGLDAIAGDWTTIHWRIASVVLLGRVSDLDAFCAAAHGAMADDTEAIKRLVELLKGVDDAERAYWDAKIAKAWRESDEEAVASSSSVESSEEAEAWNVRGEDFFYGLNGVNQDYVEAVKWYRKAARQGHAGAQYNLGWCYENGRGVSQSDTMAAKWYRKAAEQGDADAQNKLGCCYLDGCGVSQSDTKAVVWYRKAAEQGNADAQFNLGVCYDKGRGFSQSDTMAVKWYRKAAEQGLADAECNLGWHYLDGSGVSQSDTMAAKWYRKAAEQGDADAQYCLGWCYENGRGVSQSDTMAAKWYRKAADQGVKNARKALRRLGS